MFCVVGWFWNFSSFEVWLVKKLLMLVVFRVLKFFVEFIE